MKAVGLAYTALVFIEKNELNLAVGRIYVLIGTSQALDVVSDLTATIAMISALWHYRSGLPRTKAMVDKLLVYVVNRGVLITVCQTLFCVLFLLFPLKVVWAFFHLQMSKLYVNTAREHLHQQPLLASLTSFRPSCQLERSRSNSRTAVGLGPEQQQCWLERAHQHESRCLLLKWKDICR
jgi:hypothetical protein